MTLVTIANMVILTLVATGNGLFRKDHYHKQWNQGVSVSGKGPYIESVALPLTLSRVTAPLSLPRGGIGCG